VPVLPCRLKNQKSRSDERGFLTVGVSIVLAMIPCCHLGGCKYHGLNLLVFVAYMKECLLFVFETMSVLVIFMS
jgi:hypothetical protein